MHTHHAQINGWLEGNPPMPSKVMATGVLVCSANSSQFSCIAPLCRTPRPARITGRFADWIISAACCISFGRAAFIRSIAMHRIRLSSYSQSMTVCWASFVKSTSTGPGSAAAGDIKGFPYSWPLTHAGPSPGNYAW